MLNRVRVEISVGVKGKKDNFDIFFFFYKMTRYIILFQPAK